MDNKYVIEGEKEWTAIHKYLSDLYDAMPVGDDEFEVGGYLWEVGVGEKVREHVANMNIEELRRNELWRQMDAIIKDKSEFVDNAEERGYEMYFPEDAIAEVEEEINRAIRFGLVKTKEEAEQKYGDAIRNLYPAMTEEEARKQKAEFEERMCKMREEIEQKKAEAKERRKWDYRETPTR